MTWTLYKNLSHDVSPSAVKASMQKISGLSVKLNFSYSYLKWIKRTQNISIVILFCDQYLCKTRLWTIRFCLIACYYLCKQIKRNWTAASCRSHDDATDNTDRLVNVTETQFLLCEGRIQYVNTVHIYFSPKNGSKILQANVFLCGRHLDYSYITHSLRYNFNRYFIRDFP
jgi:hypothetical protein